MGEIYWFNEVNQWMFAFDCRIWNRKKEGLTSDDGGDEEGSTEHFRWGIFNNDNLLSKLRCNEEVPLASLLCIATGGIKIPRVEPQKIFGIGIHTVENKMCVLCPGFLRSFPPNRNPEASAKKLKKSTLSSGFCPGRSQPAGTLYVVRANGPGYRTHTHSIVCTCIIRTYQMLINVGIFKINRWGISNNYIFIHCVSTLRTVVRERRKRGGRRRNRRKE